MCVCTDGRVVEGGRYKRGSRHKLVRPVLRRELADGYGRVAAYWVTTVSVDGRPVVKKYAVGRYGEQGARMMASLARMQLLIMAGAWDVDAGGIMERGSYMDLFSGNRDYENVVIEGERPAFGRYAQG